MLLRAFLAAVLVVAPAQDGMVFVNYPLVHKVTCDHVWGTAFRAGGNHWLTVAHVASNKDCKIDGDPITITELDGAKDFAKLDTHTSGNGFKINCGGFYPGEWYWAIGHAHGAPFQTALLVYATYAKSQDGLRMMIGPYNFIPGMSGGPVLNSSGEVVGTVNAYRPETPISLSRELRDTDVCRS